MSHLSQRVGLIHELRQRVGSEERVDDAGDGFGVDQVCRRKHLIVAHVHTLTYSTGHTSQADRELVRQLLTHRTYTTVRQVVDIIDGCLRVNQLDQILDNLDDILLCQDTDIHARIQSQFLIDTVTAYITQVITLVGEEQVLNHLTCTCIIGRISITQLTIDIKHCLLL